MLRQTARGNIHKELTGVIYYQREETERKIKHLLLSLRPICYVARRYVDGIDGTVHEVEEDVLLAYCYQ